MSKDKALTSYPSIDKPWLKYYSEEAINASLPECTVFENIHKNNAGYPNDIALEYYGNRITYAGMFENVEKTKRAFQALGVKKGDKVIMYTSSTPEIVYSVLALCRIGAVANMINPLFTDEQVRDRINETGASIMVVLDQLYVKAEAIIKQTCVKTVIDVPVYNAMSGITKVAASWKLKKKVEYSNALISWNDFIEKGNVVEELVDVPYEKDTPLIMVYSSGTTGASKGIVLTNDGINATISHYLNPDFPYERGNTFLQIVPIWFSTGLVLSVLMPLCLGITVALEPVFSKETFAQNIKKHKPNMIIGATSLWLYVSRCRELKNMDLSFMTYPITGGEQILPREEAIINKFFREHHCNSVLLKGYGMCELGSTVSTDSISVHKTGATGFPISHVTVAAFDPETNKEKKYNERGEIRVMSPCRMKEYYKNPEATEKYFYKDADGNVWGCTGDIGYIDEDGFLYVLGRASDIFISKSGRKIYCFDIESIVLQNEHVAQCEVVGLPLEDYFVPVVHMILQDGCPLTEKQVIEEVHKYCVNHLEKDCVPYGYKFCTAFPVKNNGKRDMELLKQDKDGFIVPEDI
ncbi:MAG: class I adenylate-forming enzyme family protein [Lachnospiraceae bacterium]